MRDKFIVRERGNEAEGFVFGIMYTPPVKGKSNGVVLVGGPDRYQSDMVDVMQLVISCCAMREEGRVVQRFGTPEKWRGATKSRWTLEDVALREWEEALATLRRAGYELKKVSRFRSLMW